LAAKLLSYGASKILHVAHLLRTTSPIAGTRLKASTTRHVSTSLVGDSRWRSKPAIKEMTTIMMDDDEIVVVVVVVDDDDDDEDEDEDEDEDDELQCLIKSRLHAKDA
jgi:hypothetical protein